MTNSHDKNGIDQSRRRLLREGVFLGSVFGIGVTGSSEAKTLDTDVDDSLDSEDVFVTDFDHDGPLDDEGWEIYEGSFETRDSTLIPTEWRINGLRREQHAAAGTFTFRGVENDERYFAIKINFISDGPDFNDARGYRLRVGQKRHGQVELVRRNNDGTRDLLLTIAEDHGGKPFDVRIERDPETWDFTCYYDGEEVGTVRENDPIVESEYWVQKHGGTNQRIDGVSVSPSSGREDLEIGIAKHRPVQVVFDPDANGDGTLDFVAGKATAVLVYPGGSNLDRLDRDVTVRTEVKDGDDVISSDETELTPSEYRDRAVGDAYVEQRVEVPEPGQHTIETVLLPGDDARIRATSEKRVTEEISVVKTAELGLSFYRVIESESQKFEEVSPDDFELHISKYDELLPPRFPVAIENYESKSRGIKTASNAPGDFGLFSLFARLHFSAWYESDGHFGIGVVTTDFFEEFGVTSQDGRTTGLSPKDSVLVAEGYYVSTAHELGHQFGLHTGKEEYNYDEMLPNETDYGDGYWVHRSQLIQNAPAFMSSSNRYSDDFWLSNGTGTSFRSRTARGRSTTPQRRLLI